MSSLTLHRVGLSVLALTWLFAVIGAYYVFHRPLAPENIIAIPAALGNVFGANMTVTFGAFANVLGDAGTVLVLILLACVLGHRLSARWTFDTALEAVVLWTGIGLGTLGLLTFVLAAVGIVNQWVYWLLIFAAFALLRNDAVASWRTFRTIALPRPTRGDKARAIFCALTLAVTFLFALDPPWAWDGLQYHLIAPRLILEQGRITAPPDNFSLNFPSLIEMLFLVGMTLKGDGAVQGLHWVFLPLTLGAILVFSQKYFSWRIGWLAAAIFCAMPSMILLSTWAYNDLALVFYTFTAFAATLRARDSNRAGDFVLAGVLCGLAMGEKYTAALLPLVLAAMLFRPTSAAIRNILFLLGAAALIAAPWFIRNWILVGNPFYPYVFGGPYWDSFRTYWNTRLGTGMWTQPLSLLIVPWTATVQGTQSVLFDATIGPLMLVLLPWNLLRTPPAPDAKPAPLRTMWIFVLVLYIVWLVGVAQSNILWQTRFLFPAFPLLVILAARGLGKLSALTLPQFSIQRFASMAVAIVLTLTAVSYSVALLSDHTFGYYFGAVSRTAYLTGILRSHFQTAEWVNANLPADARLLFLWEPRTYYFARTSDADAILDNFVHLVYLYHDADSIATNLRARGYTHVILYREGLDSILQWGFDPVTDDNVQTLDTFIKQDLKPVYGPSGFGLETRKGKFGLTNTDQFPYAVYELQAP